MTEIIEFNPRFIELYHVIACEVFEFTKPSFALLSEYPAIVEFLSNIRRSGARRMPVDAVDAIGSAIPILGDVEFMIVLIDLVTGCLYESVDSILRVTLVNRFIEVSSTGAIWLILRDRLPVEVLQFLKRGLRKIAESSWQGRRVQSRQERVDSAFA
ncbi:MAG: hypothetical protein ACK5PZ_20285 [Pirellula sp.]|jgi:hypothetical protein